MDWLKSRGESFSGVRVLKACMQSKFSFFKNRIERLTDSTHIIASKLEQQTKPYKI
jgi:hypothetical protein